MNHIDQLLNISPADCNKKITIGEIDKFLSILNDKNFFIDHPFFKKLPTLDPINVATILAPFYFAVNYWMDNLLMFHQNLSDTNDTTSAKLVEENICDEFGIHNGEVDLKNCHKLTYIKFLVALGYKGKFIITNPVEKFNNELENSLYNNTTKFHACVLGAIEHFYICISTMLKQYCDKNGIKQNHYQVHEVLDKKHSMDFFNVALNQDATIGDFIDGIAKGLHLLWNIYEQLYTEVLSLD